ncbi:hypothetical protein [uncultured Photobacterium sp.]|uniref:hypothetical protein n=1 Tax=uncultured Photobacterium sp. TaxID=173973 RepID=UPI00262FB233|nr:hypothetical protein [uncultured Photobacterium sp.]
MRLTRRGWNNVIIIGVLVFIAVIQLPELIRTPLITPIAPVPSSTVIPLFAQDRLIQQLLLPAIIFQQTDTGWKSQPVVSFDIATFITRWQTLEGTLVSAQQLASLKSQLIAPRTIEVWLVGYSQPQRITAYQFPSFWLFNNGSGQWLAVTVDANFLFPPLSSKI